MVKKITINPLTRISGFLELEVQVEKNKIINAKSSGMLFRGFEQMLKGRYPLDSVYFTQRICGICSTAHSMASSLALEEILSEEPNDNNQMVREFMHGCEFIQNHLRHFYQFSMPDFVKLPDIGPLQNDHTDLRLPEKLNQKIAKDYFLSLEYSRLAHEMLAILGGKAPHNHGIFVGGVTVNLDIDKYIEVKSILSRIDNFVEEKMLEDAEIIGKYYKDYFNNGVGYKNLMSFGCFNKFKEKEITYLNPAVYLNGKILEFDYKKITENIDYAWYQGDQETYYPTEQTVIPDREKQNAYSFIKAPRYKGYPMEVGPLARMWLSGEYRRGISTMDRIIARNLEVKKIINIMKGLLERIKLQKTDQKKYKIPEVAKGKGLIDTTRGSLGHFISIKDEKIDHYEIITPTCWNLSPRDSKGQLGVIEKALMGTEIKDSKNPIEIGRIVRSFDPCVSCATHVISDKYKPLDMRIV